MRKLKNGAEVPEPVVVTTMMSLKRLAETDPVALYELREKSRNPQHQLWGNTAEKLHSLALIEGNGQPHSLVRAVVNSAVTGEMLEMRLQNPLADEDSPPPQSGKNRK